MPSEATRARESASRGEAAAKHGPLVRRLEPAQLVWRLARTMGEGRTLREPFADALDLLRAAHHRPAAMSHALSLGRTHLRVHPGDAAARAGARILEAAIVFLGVKPRTDDAVLVPGVAATIDTHKRADGVRGAPAGGRPT